MRSTLFWEGEFFLFLWSHFNITTIRFHALGGITVSAFTALSLFAGSYWDTTLNAGKIGSFLMTATSVQFAFAQLSMLAGELNRSSTSAERVFDYVNRKPKILDTGGLTLPRKINGNIEFQDVSFRYVVLFAVCRFSVFSISSVILRDQTIPSLKTFLWRFLRVKLQLLLDPAVQARPHSLFCFSAFTTHLLEMCSSMEFLSKNLIQRV